MEKITTCITTGVFLVMSLINTVSSAQNVTLDVLSKKEKAIIPIAAFTASGDITKLKTSFNQGLDEGLNINEIKEILIQIYAYAGFPRSLNGIDAFSSVMDNRKAKGLVDITGREATPLPANFDKNGYGNKVRNMLVGRDISHRTSGYPVFAPIIDTFLVEHLFADIFARDVLSYKERELVTISTLAALPGTEAQLKGHLTIAMNMGYNEAQLKNFIEVLRDKVGFQVAENCAQVLGNVLGNPPPIVTRIPLEITRKATPVDGSPEYFTGKVTIGSRFASEPSGSYGGGIVNFEAGARTAWHTHPAGQTLVVISGHGLVQSEGEPVQEILPGDVVWIPANVRHWHGAAPDSAMSHIAISSPQDGSTVSWMEHVTDEQYGQLGH